MVKIHEPSDSIDGLKSSMESYCESRYTIYGIIEESWLNSWPLNLRLKFYHFYAQTVYFRKKSTLFKLWRN